MSDEFHPVPVTRRFGKQLYGGMPAIATKASAQETEAQTRTRLRKSPKPATRGLVFRMLENVVKQTAQELANVRKRLAELESINKEFRYRGVYEHGMTYEPGNFTTFDGSLWHCKRQTSAIPGTTDSWQLACKRGKDGRDAR